MIPCPFLLLLFKYVNVPVPMTHCELDVRIKVPNGII